MRFVSSQELPNVARKLAGGDTFASFSVLGGRALVFLISEIAKYALLSFILYVCSATGNIRKTFGEIGYSS
jgi:hypothetical protein